MNARRTITTALALLFAAVISIGGPAAIHLIGDHLAPAPEAHCCEAPQQAPVLPAQPDTPDQDCPECDLLTTLTFADTSADAKLITATTPAGMISSITTPPATAVVHTPRTTRGPPAA
jgi:hypothetical protein